MNAPRALCPECGRLATEGAAYPEDKRPGVYAANYACEQSHIWGVRWLATEAMT